MLRAARAFLREHGFALIFRISSAAAFRETRSIGCLPRWFSNFRCEERIRGGLDRYSDGTCMLKSNSKALTGFFGDSLLEISKS